MGTRRGWTFAAMAALSSGGCAILAGYDFGKYGEAGGAGGGGAGGHAASSGPSSPSSSSGRAAGGASASSASHASATVGSSTSGVTTSASSASGVTSSASSSAGATSAASSSGGGGSCPGTVLRAGLLDPEAIAVDTQYVYYTTNDSPGGPSTAAFVSKDGMVSGTPLIGLLGAPSIAAANSLAYAVTWVDDSFMQPVTTVNTFGGTTGPKVIGTLTGAAPLGVTVWGATVFFTAVGTNVWIIPPGGMPVNFQTASTELPSGPIVADATGVYWPTTAGHMIASDLGGAKAISIGAVPDAVNAVATDASSVYWTDQSGGVYQLAKAGGGTPMSINPLAMMVPARGIAVDPSDSTVYFAQGTQVLRLQFPFGKDPVAVVTGLVDARGVAFDGSFVYVADRGTGSAASPDGRILKSIP